MLKNRHFISYFITALIYVSMIGLFLYAQNHYLVSSKKSEEKAIQLCISSFKPALVEQVEQKQVDEIKEIEKPIVEEEPEPEEEPVIEEEPIVEPEVIKETIPETKPEIKKETLPEPVIKKVVPKPVVKEVKKKPEVKKKAKKKIVKKRTAKKKQVSQRLPPEVSKAVLHRKINFLQR